MLIGLTYDLKDDYLAEGYSREEIAEFDRTDTIEAIEQTLRKLGFQTDRIGNIRALTQRLAKGDRWDLVFNIAEGIYGFGREAQVPCLLEAYRIPYTFSDPLVLTLTLHKGMTKRLIRDLGLATPAFAILEESAQAEQIDLPFPLFAKPIAEGTSKGIGADSKIQNQQELAEVSCKLLAQHQQPILIETFLPGREFTVGIIGTGQEARCLGVLEITLRSQADQEVYSYANKEYFTERVDYHLVNDSMSEEAKNLALAAWRGLGCRDAGRVDLRADIDNRVSFIEVNPLAGLNPYISDLSILCTKAGFTYQDLIGMIIHSALKRIDPALTSSIPPLPLEIWTQNYPKLSR